MLNGKSFHSLLIMSPYCDRSDNIMKFCLLIKIMISLHHWLSNCFVNLNYTELLKIMMWIKEPVHFMAMFSCTDYRTAGTEKDNMIQIHMKKSTNI